MRRLRLLTAGESHGEMLVGILDGFPAGVPIDIQAVNADLTRRMGGYGRGKRMKIESDRAHVVGGVRLGQSLGSPIAWLIENKDWQNWESVMAVAAPSAGSEHEGAAVAESGNRPSAVDRRRVTRPRPGHADLAGGLKYDRSDLRDILERASARETASRVAAGGFCRQFLQALEIEITSHVTRIGAAALDDKRETPFDQVVAVVEQSPVRCVDPEVSGHMVSAIDQAKNDLETLGGTFEVIARGMPPGLGSHTQWDRRLEASIAEAMLSIQAQKGVEIGPALRCACGPGSSAHDAILPGEDGGFVRPTNRAGGTEGGMTYGGELRVRVAMKPLATLRQPLPSVDIETGERVEAVVQRSDVCAVPAAAVIGEAMLALVLADACLEKFGGDSLREIQRNRNGYLEQLRNYPPS